MFKKILMSVFALLILSFSVANAEIKTYEGVGEYIGSKKETPEFAEATAKQYAERNAIERAGIFIGSQTESKNQVITQDKITAITAGILNIVDTQIEVIPLPKGYFKYRVTITAQVDIDEVKNALKEFLGRGKQEESINAKQYETLKRINEDQSRRIKELEELIKNADNIQQQEKIEEKIEEEIQYINKEELFYQKLDEANALRNNEKFAESIKLYSEAINIKQDISSAYFGRGYSYDELKQYDKAIKDFTKAISLNPNDATAYNNRGKCYLAIGNEKRAEKDLKKAKSLS